MSETHAVVADLRRRGAEPTQVEVKAAAGGMPKSLKETLSAFSNGEGGIVLLGLSEDEDFTPVASFDADAIRDAAAGMAADSMTPAVRCEIAIEPFEGARIVRIDVPEMNSGEKPCYVTARGVYGGSYLRVGDGDRKLTQYEVTQLLANQGQPTDDQQPVREAALADLDPQAVSALLTRVRERSPRAFAGVSDDVALTRLGVLVRDGENLVPSLAGLLCLGIYPQQFFPQLNVTFVALPGTTMGETTQDGRRFLDNQTVDGPLPVMVQDAVAAVERNMLRGAVIQGAGRSDRYEYPLEAVRELVVNALMHRDYGPLARGTQVQIELYADRLVVKNPGSLYGGVEVGGLGADEITSSRNGLLARLLSDVELPGRREVVCENRGSGIPRIMATLRAAGMTPPEFEATLSHVKVTVPRHALLDTDTVEWIASLGVTGLTDAQHMALAMLHHGTEVSNERLRSWGLDSREATAALTDLVDRGLAERSGGRRYARYQLSPDVALSSRVAGPDVDPSSPPERSAPRPGGTIVLDEDLESVLRAVGAEGLDATRPVAAHLGWTYSRTLSRINELIGRGMLEATAPPTSRKRRYRVTAEGVRRLSVS
ncbi:ATP-binding protein [Kocuria rosea]|uniref:ATP-binding protein n=1 Tax=Kocuria rosea TaxID=1275 RepID=UPI001C691F0D|nr:ATP-binding protein [Kocuria rosea]WIG17202.1 ATP-binding protein [Kocuria rosea]